MTDLLVPVEGAFAGRYVIEGELGHGATAAVYLARDLKHGRHVALKVLRQDLAASLESARFLREIRLLAGLQHPHILPLFDSGEHGGALYYVMPRVEGETLGQRLRRDERLPVGEALRITREVADALAYAHAHGIVHRDIKPDNILLDGTHALVADFGIARAVHRAVDSGERITSAGLAIGTPAYMSPEQASGEREVEGRSDIYSLACVLYEMLAGRYPFQGPSLQATIARRFAGPPPPVSELRDEVPREVDAALTRALAPSPEARFQTVREFCDALPPPTGETAAVKEPRWKRWKRWIGTLAGGAVVAIIVVAAILSRSPDPLLEETRYVVLPFAHAGGARQGALNGEQCELLLSQALARWRDITVVDPITAKDALARLGRQPLTLERALGVAAALRARYLVWGSVMALRDTLFLRAALYDVATGDAVRHDILRMPQSLGEAVPRFAVLADGLVVGKGGERAPGATNSSRAVAEYDAAHAALRRWRLDTAEARFARAAALDSGFADAYLWRAQVIAIDGSDRLDELRQAAQRAVALRHRLGGRDALAADALRALGEGRFPEACEHFERVLARYPGDFVASYGLGECHRLDRLVVRDARSPSGWRFRSSYRAAIDAYRAAFQAVPSTHLAFRGSTLSRLTQLLVAETNVVRRGYALTPDTAWFLAFPTLESDSLAFVPWPAADISAAAPGTRPTTVSAAVAANQRVLLEITRGWVAAFGESADAHEALALAQETAGMPGDDGALASVRRARRLATEPSQSLRLSVAEVRLLVKTGAFARARASAESLLTAHLAPSSDEAWALRGVATLLGKPMVAASLARRSAVRQEFVAPDWSIPAVPTPLAQEGAALLAFASLGAPSDSLVVLEARVEDFLRSYVPPADRARVADAVMLVPAELVFPVLGARTAHRRPDPPYPLLRMQASLVRGDSAALRRTLAELAEYRAPIRAGDVAIEGTYHEALLLLALGDSAAAEEHLDLSLQALSTLGTALLDEMPQAGALPRAMALRAELAARRGGGAQARRWARAVSALWADADVSLQPIVERVRALAGVPGP